jgi:hypothetical protein
MEDRNRNTADFAFVAHQKTDFMRTRMVDSVLMDVSGLGFQQQQTQSRMCMVCL